MSFTEKLILGDCRELMKNISSSSIDLIYMDPPFFTQKTHSLKTKDNSKTYEFTDKWNSIHEYIIFIKESLTECKRVLKDTGSIFVHCDKKTAHYIKVAIDEIMGINNFQSEIIWTYKRWSNSKKGLLNSHQNIFFYSKTKNFKFNTIYTDYSPTTNIDQILQDRVRDINGKSVYKKDDNGDIVLSKTKKGVPLSDVWEIPYLNPKAKERVGYPTQKPVILLNQIITLCTDIDNVVLDPFCGSGTTCVSAKHLNRNFIGIDISQEALSLTKQRLEEMVITQSPLLEKGKESYIEKTSKELILLNSIEAIPVQRNNGIDGFLKKQFKNKPVPVRIQKDYETLEDAIEAITSSTQSKKANLKVIIQTNNNRALLQYEPEKNIVIIKSNDLLINEKISHLTNHSS